MPFWLAHFQGLDRSLSLLMLASTFSGIGSFFVITNVKVFFCSAFVLTVHDSCVTVPDSNIIMYAFINDQCMVCCLAAAAFLLSKNSELLTIEIMCDMITADGITISIKHTVMIYYTSVENYCFYYLYDVSASCFSHPVNKLSFLPSFISLPALLLRKTDTFIVI